MCGLFGYTGKIPAKPHAIKLLWIFSRYRGTDSTGLYRNKLIYRTWNDYHSRKSGDSIDAVYGLTLRETVEHHTIIGHCRAKSVGFVTENNTHPFEYKLDNGRWIFAHNGTIKNIEALAKHYNIPRQYTETDSQTFGHILAERGFDVLKEYTGTAAFSLYNEDEDTLYLWRGASKHDRNLIENERPLYLYQGRNYYYWASDANYLATAMNTERNIVEIEPNTLYKIQNGFIIDSVVYDRNDVISYYVAPPAVNNNRDIFAYDSRKDRKKFKTKPTVVVPYEPNPQNIARGGVYFWKGLYYRQGHILSGIYELREDGIIPKNNESGIDYYFYEGYLLRSVGVYNKLKSGELSIQGLLSEPYTTTSSLLHPKSILMLNKGGHTMCYMNGAFLHNCTVIPIFGKNSFRFSQQGEIIGINVVGETVTESTEQNWEKYFPLTHT